MSRRPRAQLSSPHAGADPIQQNVTESKFTVLDTVRAQGVPPKMWQRWGEIILHKTLGEWDQPEYEEASIHGAFSQIGRYWDRYVDHRDVEALNECIRAAQYILLCAVFGNTETDRNALSLAIEVGVAHAYERTDDFGRFDEGGLRAARLAATAARAYGLHPLEAGGDGSVEVFIDELFQPILADAFQ